MNSRLLKIHAEVFENGISLGSFLTDGEERLIIGSSKKADLVVPNKNVSHIHAMLKITGEKELLLYDLGSEQGTFVSGKRIVERQMSDGDFFEIGGHRVKVSLIEEEQRAEFTEKSIFWQKAPADAKYLNILRFQNDLIQNEWCLDKNQILEFGKRQNQFHFEEALHGKQFIQRKTENGKNSVQCYLPNGFRAEILSPTNQLLRLIESAENNFSFHSDEKVRLISNDGIGEFLLFWQNLNTRSSRSTRDNEINTFQKALVGCALIGLFVLLGMHFILPAKKDVIEEATTPKSSYFRTTMQASAPAPKETESAQPAKGDTAKAAEPNAAKEQKPSNAANISSTLSKLLKKTTLSAEAVNQAVGASGKQTVRNALSSSSAKTESINAGAMGGGAVNMASISNNLGSGSGGKVGSLNGFANGKGTSIGGTGGNGFGGKGFDMSLGGDETEAIGGLDKSLIAAVVQANIGQIKHCYEKQLIVDPNIFGKVVAQWSINKDGVVSTSSVKKTTMNNATVENCIAGKIKNWTFPKPKGGGQVLVSYPFMFKALN